MSEAMQAADPEAETMSAAVLADAFERAADVAWAGVSNPIEGTILSVARAAARGAAIAAREAADSHHPPGREHQLDPAATYAVALTALEAAREALARTPEQLPLLARAGVVDAGGAGFVLVLEALESILADRAHDGAPRSSQHWDRIGASGLVANGEEFFVADRFDCEPTHGGYEVMYVLHADVVGAERVRNQLSTLGSSVMVVGGPDVWRVHVHVDRTAAALDVGSRVGPVQQVTITSLDGSDLAAETSPLTPELAVVCCAPGPGLARLFAAAGARVVHSVAGDRASTGALLQAARDTAAAVVAMLPNDGDTVLAARAAADEGSRVGCDIRVVPTVAAVQGLAAMSLWEPERAESVQAMLRQMVDVAESVSYGAVVMATAAADTAAGPCLPGQWLGLAQGRIVCVEDQMEPVTGAVLTALSEHAPDEPEVLTVIAGEDHDTSELLPLLEAWAEGHPELEIRRVWGGQPTYPWLLGLE